MTVTRQAIADALSAAGLTGRPTQPPSIGAGDAWPVWRSTQWANATPGGPRPRSPDVTVAEGDAQVELVGDALWMAGLRVVTVEPWRIAVTDNAEGVPVLRYTVDD
jgi:hypothetical protein